MPSRRASLGLLLSLLSMSTVVLSQACGEGEEAAGTPPAPQVDAEGVDGPVVTPDAAEAGDAPAAVTAVDACRAYVTAACERREACGLGTAGCRNIADLCPDVYLGPGTTRTPESLLACAAVRRTQPCAEIIANVTPACATPGTRGPGEACSFVGQCASFACSGGSNGTCGQCLPVRAPGTGCPGANETCGYNMRCESPEAGCAPIVVPTTLAEGATCPAAADGGGAPCPADAPCVAATSGAPSGTCTKLPTSGACVYRVRVKGPPTCAPGSVCFGPDAGPASCVGLGALGEPCAAFERECAGDLRCDGTAGTCQPRRGATEPCLSDADCQASLYCTTGTNRTCAPRAAVGQRCGFVVGGPTVECAVGATCETLAADAGGGRACVGHAALGEACGAPFGACAGNLVCTAGRCAVAPCVRDAGSD